MQPFRGHALVVFLLVGCIVSERTAGTIAAKKNSFAIFTCCPLKG